MGRNPKFIRVHLLGDLIVVRLIGVLSKAERLLVESHPAEKGRDLLRARQAGLMETARPMLDAMIQRITGMKVLGLHRDLSTDTGEEVIVFTLDGSPLVGEAR